MKTVKYILSLVALTAFVQPAQAHHSSAMFDFEKQVVLEDATVKEWQYTNPHCWLILTVTKEDGTTEDWALEGGNPGSPNLKPRTFVPGQKVKAITNPMRDGRKAGKLNHIEFEDGSIWETPNPYGSRRN